LLRALPVGVVREAVDVDVEIESAVVGQGNARPAEKKEQ
jgi:hypothetical protein